MINPVYFCQSALVTSEEHDPRSLTRLINMVILIWRPNKCNALIIIDNLRSPCTFTLHVHSPYTLQRDVVSQWVSFVIRSYAELEVGVTENSKVSQNLSAEDDKKALQILTTFAEGAKFQPSASSSSTTEVSAVQQLKSRRIYQKFHQGIVGTAETYQEKRELSSDCGIASGSLVVHLEACSALFEYLSTGIQGVLSMCSDVISAISHDIINQAGHNEMDIELILTFYIRLFRFHCKSGRTLPTKDTRGILHFALEKFPDNPEFLLFYIQRESKSILTGEVRRTLDKATETATTPVPWIFAIYYEQLRAKSLVSVIECNDPSALISQGSTAALTSLPVTGVVHRQCSLFERAASSPSGRHCVALWRMFMEFQVKYFLIFICTNTK